MKRTRTLLPVLGLGLFSISPSPASAGVPEEARPLLEAHVSWLGGWDALDRIHDLSFEGTIEVAGLTGTVSAWIRRDGYQRTEYDLKVVKGTEVLTPDGAWEINASGQVEEMGREKAADQRRSLARSFFQHLRGEGVEISVRDAMEKDGESWSVVRFAYPNGDLVDRLIDPDDGSSVWSRTVTDNDTAWVKSGDFRSIDGVRFPYRQETIYGNPMQDQTLVWNRIEANEGIPLDRFQVAGGASLASIAGGAASTGWMPIELYMDRYIFLEGKVNGRETDIVLDSGAGMTVLDQPVADDLGLKPEGKLPAKGTGGMVEAGIVNGITLTLGDLEIGPVTAATIDLADVNRRLGRDLSVILGKEVFHNVVVDIDYPRSRIRFHDPERFAYEGPGHRLPVLAAEDGHKDLKIRIEGLPEAVVGLDTGQGGALSIFKAYAEEHGLLENRMTSSQKGGGVGGTTISTLASLDSVTVAGYTLRNVPASFHREDVGGAFDTARQAGNLGAGILNRFRVAFDYPHGCLWMEPGEDLDAPFPRNKTGLSFLHEDDHLTVQYVSPGSPAEAAGWKEGDTVIALDGKPVDGDWWKRSAAWMREKDGAEVRLTMKDGSVRSLVLKSYY